MVEADSGWVAVWFTAPVVETYHRADGAPPSLAALGPDLCRPDVDIEAAVEHMAALTGPDDEIKPVLLDQRVAAGIGNVYASRASGAARRSRRAARASRRAAPTGARSANPLGRTRARRDAARSEC